MKAFFWGGPRHGAVLHISPATTYYDLPLISGDLPSLSAREDRAHVVAHYHRSRYFDDPESDTAIFLHHGTVEDEDAGRGLMRLLFAVAESEGHHLRDALTVINKAYEEISR